MNATTSNQHPHEPEIPPAFDIDGRCLVCGMSVEIADLRAEISRRDQFRGCDGCSTGDCPHDTVQECADAQAVTIAEQAAEIERLADLIVELEGIRDGLFPLAMGWADHYARSYNGGVIHPTHAKLIAPCLTPEQRDRLGLPKSTGDAG